MKTGMTWVCVCVATFSAACASPPAESPASDRVAAAPQILPVADSPEREVFVRRATIDKSDTFLLLATTSKDINQLYLKGYKFYKLKDVSDPTVRSLLGQCMRLSVSPLVISKASLEEWVNGADLPEEVAFGSSANLAPLGSSARANHRCVVNPLAYRTTGQLPLRAWGPRNGLVCIESVDGIVERGIDPFSGKLSDGAVRPSGPHFREFFDARTSERLGPVFEEDKRNIKNHTSGEFWSKDGLLFLALHGDRVFVYDLTRCIPKPDPSKPAAQPAPDQVRSLFEGGPKPKPKTPTTDTPGSPAASNPPKPAKEPASSEPTPQTRSNP